jgi:hypothetical protein
MGECPWCILSRESEHGFGEFGPAFVGKCEERIQWSSKSFFVELKIVPLGLAAGQSFEEGVDGGFAVGKEPWIVSGTAADLGGRHGAEFLKDNEFGLVKGCVYGGGFVALRVLRDYWAGEEDQVYPPKSAVEGANFDPGL